MADAIRGLAVGQALDVLKFSKRVAAKPMHKLLKSALVNASQKEGLDLDTLRVREVRLGPGPTLKRWMPRARGIATPVKKRTSHVTIILEEK